jgi:hypothetical protein
MLEMLKAIWSAMRGRETPPPPVIVARDGGGEYPLTVVDGRWTIHSESGSETVHGLAHAARIAGDWAKAGVRPPRDARL